MCVDAWKQKFYNPSGTKIITREYGVFLSPFLFSSFLFLTPRYYHNPAPILTSFDPRGGATTADHVDILGNHEYLDDILRIVSGSDSRDNDRILSRIKHVSRRITARAQVYAEAQEREKAEALAQQESDRVPVEEEDDRSR
jgi:phospholipid:diacylglycerol acyltransferase